MPLTLFQGDALRPTDHPRNKGWRYQRLARGIYSSDTQTPLPLQVRRHLVTILAYLRPGGVIGGDAAWSWGETLPATVAITHPDVTGTRRLALPGLTVCLGKGVRPQAGDRPLEPGLWVASPSRVLLEWCQQGEPGQTLLRQTLQAWSATPSERGRLALQVEAVASSVPGWEAGVPLIHSVLRRAV